MATIHVNDKVKDKLERRKGETESYSDVVSRLLGQERRFYEEIVEEKLEEIKHHGI